ncbi:hypothetical protein AZE42_12766 [Rhizopogon vesiculosus]|uniref:Uncharacterized protein n=1 Tax=Rhizopogon vesiculosus TaxID=180088 RepID=A0A1J8QX98_9AGAM|nr:hypothetical protein AZE42_12766 [Rhizopogon vesiculosus]
MSFKYASSDTRPQYETTIAAYIRSAKFGAYHSTATTFSPESVSLITDSVIQTVLAADLSLLYPLLFSQSFDPSPVDHGPALVNVPDLEGWSAIHYCVSVSNPSVEILDA